MALIKCNECGHDISDKAISCPKCSCPVKPPKLCKECCEILSKEDKICSKCGCPVKKINLNKNKVILISVIVFIIIILGLLLLIFNKGTKLICKFETTNNVGVLDYEITYTFDNDGSVKSLKGYQYTKPNDSKVSEYLWSITNKDQEQYNYYDGLSYKATYSENNEITLIYSIEAKKAPTMFNTITSLSGIKGITSNLTKEEIKNILENNDYKCN